MPSDVVGKCVATDGISLDGVALKSENFCQELKRGCNSCDFSRNFCVGRIDYRSPAFVTGIYGVSTLSGVRGIDLIFTGSDASNVQGRIISKSLWQRLTVEARNQVLKILVDLSFLSFVCAAHKILQQC